MKGEPQKHFFASVAYSQGLDGAKLHSFVEVLRTVSRPSSSWDVLHSFKNQSLWKCFQCDGDRELINRGVIMGVIVHNGSYMKYVPNDVCSAVS